MNINASLSDLKILQLFFVFFVSNVSCDTFLVNDKVKVLIAEYTLV